MGREFQAAQSGMGGWVTGRNIGGAIAPSHSTQNSYYVPPDPSTTYRDANGRVAYGPGFSSGAKARPQSHPRIAGLPPPENPMMTFLRQAMGMPVSQTGQRMLERNTKYDLNRQWQLGGRQFNTQMHGPPMGGQGNGLDQVNSFIGPQLRTQVPFWGVPTNQPPPTF